MTIRAVGWLERYGAAVFATALVVPLRYALGGLLSTDTPTLFLVAVIAVSWLGGTRAGLVATACSVAIEAWLFGQVGLDPTTLDVGTRLALLASLGGLASWLGGSMHQARERVAQSGELLRVTLASVGDAVITTDAAGRITYVNPVAESATGWTNAAAAGVLLDDVFRIVNEDTRETVENPATRALRDGIVVGLANHTVLTAKDGTERPIDDSAAPIRNESGLVVGCVLIFRDISQRKLDESAMRVSETRYRRLFESAKDGILLLDTDTATITDANPYIARMLGFTRADLLGMELWQLGLFQDRATNKAVIEHLRERGFAHYDDLPLTTRSGQSIYVEFVSNVYVEDGQSVIQCNIRDVTERKRMLDAERGSADALRQYAADLSEADRRKTEFLAILAHELRNPLAPIRNALRIVRLTPGDANLVDTSSAMVERQVEQLVRLVDDLLDVSRISQGRIELRRSRVELLAAVQHAVAAASELAQCMSHEVTVRLPQEPIYVLADPTRLAQIVGNLLNNACKYTDNGGQISVSVERQDEHAVIRVRDNGVGIAADQLPRVFDMFMQVDRSLERSVGGLGIGLTLVKTLVDLHGGTLEAHSLGIGQGSEFVVQLPALTDASVPWSVSSDNQAAPAVPRSILVVDDNEDAANSLAELLRLDGHDVHTAYDGLAALDVAATVRPDVMLLDIGLPKLNGYEVCRAIRERAWGRNVVMVALTGWGQDDDRERSSDAGFDRHMVKPVDLSDLTAVLAQLPTRPRIEG